MSRLNPKILVVDDEPNTRAYIGTILMQEDWRVDTASDGFAALELVERTRYDAIVLDYRMPGMNGADLCRQIEVRRPGIPKVLVTGYPTIDTVYPAVESGVNHVLAKPLNPRELIDVLHRELAAFGPP